MPPDTRFHTVPSHGALTSSARRKESHWRRARTTRRGSTVSSVGAMAAAVSSGTARTAHVECQPRCTGGWLRHMGFDLGFGGERRPRSGSDARHAGIGSAVSYGHARTPHALACGVIAERWGRWHFRSGSEAQRAGSGTPRGAWGGGWSVAHARTRRGVVHLAQQLQLCPQPLQLGRAVGLARLAWRHRRCLLGRAVLVHRHALCVLHCVRPARTLLWRQYAKARS